MLGGIADPRRAEGKLYGLPHVFLFSILAVMAGANSYRAIHSFIDVHLHRLKETFELNWRRAPAYTTVRGIHGIDAPEHRQLCRSVRGEAYRCGHKSTHALAALIGQQPVRCLKRDVDRYGRLVAQCFAGSTDLEAEQVRQGWAVAYRKYSRAYVTEEEQARRARRGIWAGEFAMPWDWRRQNR